MDFADDAVSSVREILEWGTILLRSVKAKSAFLLTISNNGQLEMEGMNSFQFYDFPEFYKKASGIFEYIFIFEMQYLSKENSNNPIKIQ